MVGLSQILSIITQNVNGSNTPMKNQRLPDCIDLAFLYCLQETWFKYKYTYRLKVKWWKSDAMLKLINIDLKGYINIRQSRFPRSKKHITIDKRTYFIIIKW